jgi:hypothetical protein
MTKASKRRREAAKKAREALPVVGKHAVRFFEKPEGPPATIKALAKLGHRVAPYSEAGNHLTSSELERSKHVETEILEYHGYVRIFQGGAAGTKG